MNFLLIASLVIELLLPAWVHGQAADWQEVVWREPQVRYLLADITLGGDVEMYRKYAVEERDPDSREAIRLWDAGVRVVNLKDFERKWIKNEFGKDGRVMRIVLRGSNRTIAGNEVMLTFDMRYEQHSMRIVLAKLSLGMPTTAFEHLKADPAVGEALRGWTDGARATNAEWFELLDGKDSRQLVYRGMRTPADGAQVRLNSDMAYPETNVRYFLADMYLGGSRDFYMRVAHAAHEMGCLEAVARHDAGVTVTNLQDLERKRIDGKVVITRKGTIQRIVGADVKLSTD
ncbi:MAG: hypothetical protein NTU53_16570 [Planctomycetota bacterium]|nr:hypothetical protein [Planctomycetota bacterium]